jgi:hypothetical protein
MSAIFGCTGVVRNSGLSARLPGAAWLVAVFIMTYAVSKVVLKDRMNDVALRFLAVMTNTL